MSVPGVDTTTWQYNGRGGVLQETRAIAGAGSFTTVYTYDQVDRVRTLTYPSGEVITTTYNARGLPDTLTGAETYVAGATYDAAGRLTQLQLRGGALQTSYGYYPWDSNPNGGRLQTLRSGPPATPNALQDLGYTYDLTGNVQTITDAGAATTYGYDALARLTTVAGQARYTYDPTGNLLSKREPDLGWDLTLTYTDTAHVHAPAVVSDPALGFGYELEYDANGNLTQARSAGATNGVTDTFTWDAENRLARRETQAVVTQWYNCPDLPDDPTPCVPGWRTTWQTTGWDAYTRDADAAVLRRTDATGEHLYIGSHYELHAGVPTSYYPFGGRRVAMREGTAASYLFADHLGSTRVVEAGAGTPAQQYTPWGEIVEGGNNTLPTEYTYTGQREAGATGGLRLLDYGARSYWPFAGRFISPDTIVPQPGDPQSLNRYAYTRNNALRYTDPTGMFSEDEIMKYYGVKTWDEVLALYEKGGRLEGLWGWLETLRRAELGDRVALWDRQCTDSRCNSVEGGLVEFFDGTFAEQNGQLVVLGGTRHGRAATFSADAVALIGRTHYGYSAHSVLTRPQDRYYHVRFNKDKVDWTSVGLGVAGLGQDAGMAIAIAGAATVNPVLLTVGISMVGLGTAAEATGVARSYAQYRRGEAVIDDLTVSVGTSMAGLVEGPVGVGFSIGGILYDLGSGFVVSP